MTRKRDCLEITLKVRVPLNAGDTASWAAALKAIDGMAHVLPTGSVVETGMPKFGKMAAVSAEVIPLKPEPEPELPESLRR